MDFLQALVLAIVEGLTEFLPVSSTAHMIFVSSFFGTEGDEFVKMFQVSIQFGAILSVVALYWKKFFDFNNLKFYYKLAFAIVPALILGKLFDDKIEAVLEKPLPIAIMLVIGGIVLLFIDKLFKNTTIDAEEKVTFRKAIKACGLIVHRHFFRNFLRSSFRFDDKLYFRHWPYAPKRPMHLCSNG